MLLEHLAGDYATADWSNTTMANFHSQQMWKYVTLEQFHSQQCRSFGVLLVYVGMEVNNITLQIVGVIDIIISMPS